MRRLLDLTAVLVLASVLAWMAIVPLDAVKSDLDIILVEMLSACDGKSGEKLRQLTTDAAAILQTCTPLEANLFYWNLFQAVKLEWVAWVMGRLAGLLMENNALAR